MQPGSSAPHELSRRRRLLVLVICSMSLLIVGLDTTIVNVALPAIHRSFPSQLSGLQWTIDAYTLVIASLLMLSGSTADRVGRRRTFQTGLAVKVVFKGALVAPGDHQQVGQARVDGFFHDVLDGRTIDHRQHFLRHCLGGGQEASPQSGSRNDGFSNFPHCHR
jgi:hypothetical protein